MFSAIGVVHNNEQQREGVDWRQVVSEIEVWEGLEAGLSGLHGFSHIIVVYNLHKVDYSPNKHLQGKPHGRTDMPIVGVFSHRTENRPNPIGVTVVELLKVEGCILKVRGLDAVDGTPIWDIKPYVPQYDLRVDAKVPDWVEQLLDDYY